MVKGFEMARDPAGMNAAGAGGLPGHLGIEVTHASDGELRGGLPIRGGLFAPHGFMHGATVVALTDSLCGYGTAVSLPPGATSFATVSLNATLVGAARAGELRGTAFRTYAGRSQQVWDAKVVDEPGRTVAMLRCTQLVLWPAPSPARGTDRRPRRPRQRPSPEGTRL